MNKLKIKLFGELFDSSSLSALGVQTIGQRRFDKEMPGCFQVQVSEFDDTHIKMRVNRSLPCPKDLEALYKPGMFLQIDKWILFPDLSFISDWGGYFIVTSDCQNVLDEINEERKSYRGSKLATLSVQSTPDYIDVYMSK